MSDESRRRQGPRGGRTTVTTTGMVKKNLWLPEPMAEELRRRAFDERRAEAAIVREALRRYLGREEAA